jgi:hypothetical protein
MSKGKKKVEEEKTTPESIRKDLKNGDLITVLDIVLHNDVAMKVAKRDGKNTIEVGDIELSFEEWLDIAKDVLKEHGCDYDSTMNWFNGQEEEVRGYLIEKRGYRVIDETREYILAGDGCLFNLRGLNDYGDCGVVYYGVATVKRMMRVLDLIDEAFISDECFDYDDYEEDDEGENENALDKVMSNPVAKA